MKEKIKTVIIIILLVVVLAQSAPFQQFIMRTYKGDKVRDTIMMSGTVVGYNDPGSSIFKFFIISADSTYCRTLTVNEDSDLVMPAEIEEAFRNREYFGKATVYCTQTYKDYESNNWPATTVVSLE